MGVVVEEEAVEEEEVEEVMEVEEGEVAVVTVAGLGC